MTGRFRHALVVLIGAVLFPAGSAVDVGSVLDIQSLDGSKISLKSWKGDYLHRPDSAHGVTSWSTGIGNEWIIEVLESGKVSLKSWKGDYLHRPDSAHGVTSWSTGIGNEWILEVLESGKVSLKSWKGDYLHRPDSVHGVTSWSTGKGNEWTLEVQQTKATGSTDGSTDGSTAGLPQVLVCIEEQYISRVGNRPPTQGDCGILLDLDLTSCSEEIRAELISIVQLLGCSTCGEGKEWRSLSTCKNSPVRPCYRTQGGGCFAAEVTMTTTTATAPPVTDGGGIACDRTKHFMLDAFTAGHPKNTDFVELELGAAESQDDAERRCTTKDRGHGVFYVWHNHALQYGTEYNAVKCHVLLRPAANVEFYRQFPAYGIVGAVCLPGTRRQQQDGLNGLAPEARGGQQTVSTVSTATVTSTTTTTPTAPLVEPCRLEFSPPDMGTVNPGETAVFRWVMHGRQWPKVDLSFSRDNGEHYFFSEVVENTGEYHWQVPLDVEWPSNADFEWNVYVGSTNASGVRTSSNDDGCYTYGSLGLGDGNRQRRRLMTRGRPTIGPHSFSSVQFDRAL